MKITETLFEAGNYETPKKLNRSHKQVPVEVADQIESHGITSEQLDTLGLPVFRYKTQITIHGRFPDIGSGRLHGYKSIFQNQNGSIGVKYIAVDALKKDRAYSALKSLGFAVSKNSTKWEAVRLQEVKSKDEVQQRMTEAKELENKIKGTYTGHVTFQLGQLWGVIYAVTTVTVQAMYENQVDDFILKATGRTWEAIQAERKEKEAERQREWDEEKAKREAERQAIIDRRTPLLEPIVKQFEEAGYLKDERKPMQGDRGIGIAWNDDDTYRYVHFLIDKQPRQRDLRLFEAYTDSIDLPERSAYQERRKLSGRPLKMRFLNSKGHTTKSQPETIQQLTSDITVVEYGKGIAVQGNTYPVKDRLKAMGGKFNRYLTGGPGWVLPASKKDEVLTLKA